MGESSKWLEILCFRWKADYQKNGLWWETQYRKRAGGWSLPDCWSQPSDVLGLRG